MKCLRILSITILLADLVTQGYSEVKKEHQFFPSLPIGKYNVFYKALFPCSTNSDELLRHNLYLYKGSQNISIVKGNLTFKIPFDDSLWFNINMAIKDAIGGWKDNAFFSSIPNACSSFKKLLGTEWDIYWNSFGINDTKCPIPVGTYIAKGYDLSRFITHTSFPSTFLYGTYKARVYFTDKNKKEYGCTIYVLEIKRPWENE